MRSCPLWLVTPPELLSSIIFFCICSLLRQKWYQKTFSPVAIIRNAKIWNNILLLAITRTLSSNLDLEYPAVSEIILFEESTTSALTPNILGISTFLGILKSGGNLNGVTAM